MTARHPHGVALAQAVGVDLDLFPAIGVFEVFLGQVDLEAVERLIGGGVGAIGDGRLIEREIVERQLPLVFIDLAGVLAHDDGHPVALEQGLHAVACGVIPAQALGAAVHIGRVHLVERGQLHPGFLQRLDQLGLQLGVGKVTGQAPAVGVAVVFFPQRHVFLDRQGLPIRGVLELDRRQVDALRGALVAVELASEPAFLGRPHQRGHRMVAGHQHHVTSLDIAPGLALDALTVFGGVVLLHAAKHIDPADLAAGHVAFGHAHGVAGFDGLLVGRDHAPGAAVFNLLLGKVVQRAQIDQLAQVLVEQPLAVELVDDVVASGLAIGVQHLDPHPRHAAGGDAQHAAGFNLAQLHITVAGAVVPALAFVAAKAGLFASIGQRIERVGRQARCLHRVVIKLFAVHACGDRAQLDRATAGHQVGAHHIGQGVSVYAVESQRQANGHRSGGACARERGRQGGRAGDGVDGGEVFRAHRDGLGLQRQGVGRVAQHAGLQT